MSKFFSPPNGEYPRELPDRWVLPDGKIYTNLTDLTDEQLNSYGWTGPITMPTMNEYYQYDVNWNSDTRSFDYTNLSQSEKERRVNYNEFWHYLNIGTVGVGSTTTSGGIFYKKMKSEAKTSLTSNIIFTEFISEIYSARFGKYNIQKIQELFDEILIQMTFTDDEIDELKEIFNNCGLFTIYNLDVLNSSD